MNKNAKNTTKMPGRGNKKARNVKRKPVFIFYDCEAASSGIFKGDIIEIAARVATTHFTTELDITELCFKSLINTTQDLSWFALNKCHITKDDLEEQQGFSDVFESFITWIKSTVKQINKTDKTTMYFPVLCAHGGLSFDFPMLLANMERSLKPDKVLTELNLHFADTFDLCKQLQTEKKCSELNGVKLSMDALFDIFCPEDNFLDRHRAMGDVNAMIKIFDHSCFQKWLKDLNYIAADVMCEIYHKQCSLKTQQLIWEEKMVKLDAYTKCVNLKKLVHLQMTYKEMQNIFENCASFMDFYQTMKEFGIDRKTAKYFACQFSGLGLRNQGIVSYSGTLDIQQCNIAGEQLDLSVDPEVYLKEEVFERPRNVPEIPASNFMPEPLENWEDDLDNRRSFVLTIRKPETPLSHTVDDIVLVKSTKTNQKHNKTEQKRNKNNQIGETSNPWFNKQEQKCTGMDLQRMEVKKKIQIEQEGIRIGTKSNKMGGNNNGVERSINKSCLKGNETKDKRNKVEDKQKSKALIPNNNETVDKNAQLEKQRIINEQKSINIEQKSTELERKCIPTQQNCIKSVEKGDKYNKTSNKSKQSTAKFKSKTTQESVKQRKISTSTEEDEKPTKAIPNSIENNEKTNLDRNGGIRNKQNMKSTESKKVSIKNDSSKLSVGKGKTSSEKSTKTHLQGKPEKCLVKNDKQTTNIVVKSPEVSHSHCRRQISDSKETNNCTSKGGINHENGNPRKCVETAKSLGGNMKSVGGNIMKCDEKQMNFKVNQKTPRAPVRLLKREACCEMKRVSNEGKEVFSDVKMNGVASVVNNGQKETHRMLRDHGENRAILTEIVVFAKTKDKNQKHCSQVTIVVGEIPINVPLRHSTKNMTSAKTTVAKQQDSEAIKVPFAEHTCTVATVTITKGQRGGIRTGADVEQCGSGVARHPDDVTCPSDVVVQRECDMVTRQHGLDFAGQYEFGFAMNDAKTDEMRSAEVVNDVAWQHGDDVSHDGTRSPPLCPEDTTPTVVEHSPPNNYAIHSDVAFCNQPNCYQCFVASGLPLHHQNRFPNQSNRNSNLDTRDVVHMRYYTPNYPYYTPYTPNMFQRVPYQY